jgi:hypothetical protein
MTTTITTTLACSRCGRVFDSSTQPFAEHDMKRAASEAGWRIDQGAEWWVDLCPSCWSKERGNGLHNRQA